MTAGLEISRRAFLKLFAGAATIGITAPVMDQRRQPYILPGDSASWVGKGPSDMAFPGSKTVYEVHQWDGVGYPVEVWNGGYGRDRATEMYYDFDLADFSREIPDKFWHNEHIRKRYNNVHTYLREQRFGETLAEAVANLNFRQANT